MTAASFTFTHAISRRPSQTIANGLRAEDTGQPHFETFCKHHTDYVAALENTGAEVTVLNSLDEFPDSVFVEDVALCLPRGTVILRPGAPTRIGEAAQIVPVIAKFYNEIVTIDGPGFIEGGDILATENEILVGCSARTDSEGVAELARHVADWGYSVREVQTPPDILHFKTDCSLLDEETILSTRRLAASGCFDGYRIIHTAAGEDACANSIRFNDLVIMPDGFPKTTDKLVAAGYDVYLVGNSEAAKLDGGMSCLSLRFSPPGRTDRTHLTPKFG